MPLFFVGYGVSNEDKEAAMGNRVILVMGGARSGKSEFAEKLMYRSSAERKGYIATSQVLDEEMRYRVIVHQERRPKSWKTFEVMHEAGELMESILAASDVVLFDCITMYVSNLLMDHMDHRRVETLGVGDLTILRDVLTKDLDRIFDVISTFQGKEIIFVSDELGMGIVPGNAMSRVYRDLVGLANQYVASRAEAVYLSIAGITIDLRKSEVRI